MFLLRRVRLILIERHPDVLLKLERSSFFPDQGIRKYLRGKRYRELNDEALNTEVRRIRRLWVLTIAVWLAYGAAIVSTFH